MATDLTNADIDRIFGRLERDIFVGDDPNETELYERILSHPKTKYWNKNINQFFYNKIKYKPLITRLLKGRTKSYEKKINIWKEKGLNLIKGMTKPERKTLSKTKLKFYYFNETEIKQIQTDGGIPNE